MRTAMQFCGNTIGSKNIVLLSKLWKKLFSKQVSGSSEQQPSSLVTTLSCDIAQPKVSPVPKEKYLALQLADLAKHNGKYYHIVSFGEETLTLLDKEQKLYFVVPLNEIEDVQGLYDTQGEIR